MSLRNSGVDIKKIQDNKYLKLWQIFSLIIKKSQKKKTKKSI